MNKYIAIALILLTAGIMIIFQSCFLSLSPEEAFNWEDHMPASIGKYKIDSVANEPLLFSVWTPTEPASSCGLADDDFIKYAMDRIDYTRQFQFIVFVDGKPLVGERCLRKAFLFYLK